MDYGYQNFVNEIYDRENTYPYLKKIFDSGQYGFKKLKIHRIDAEVIEYNKKSINFFQKLGFESDAVMRDYIFRNGEWWDLVVLSNRFSKKAGVVVNPLAR